MKDLTWIDDLKIRGGWGQTGNQAGLSDYSYLQRFVINRQNWWEDGKALAVPVITMNELRNSDLTWETTTQTNFGLDLTILKNRLTFALDYYSKYTTDMLMYVTLPAGASTARLLHVTKVKCRTKVLNSVLIQEISTKRISNGILISIFRPIKTN
jgi:hypothetical protein